jgi:RNAse (barnase) inhibitor barstar
MNSGVFRFGEKVDAQVVAIATVPSGVSTKDALFDALSSGLSFPEYFGRNFDALEECLRDLAWLPAERQLLLPNERQLDFPIA